MGVYAKPNSSEDLSRILIKSAITLIVIISCCSFWDVTALPNAGVFSFNRTMEGLYSSEQPQYPVKPPKRRDTTRSTQGALFLICGVILGVPLGILAACGLREFVCAMYEKYRIEALRRNYLYRLKMPTTIPVR